MPRSTAIALATCLAGVVACSGPTEPTHPAAPLPPDIQAFVDRSPLPKKQAVVVQSVPPGGAVQLFTVDYGEAHDCFSGCFYSRAWGLLNDDKIAWFEIQDYDGTDLGAIPLYDFDASDSLLFRPELEQALEDADWWFYRYVFLHRVAESTDIGPDPLATAVHSLYDFGDPLMARLLIANPVVRADCDLLLALAGLPDDYAALRAEARELLKERCPAG